MWRNKVLWTEGLFLRPQHFQQQERYLENLVDRRGKAQRAYDWGFESLELDDAALALGKISIRSASGVLRDGTVFEFPAEDLPPEPLDVPESMKNALVHLAIALDRPGVPNTTLAETAPSAMRVTQRTADVPDVVDGFVDPAPMQLGALRLVLLAHEELTGAYAAMPVARVIERRADGQVLLDRPFVAPALDSLRSPTLRGWIDEIRGKLRQRSEVLAQSMTAGGRSGVAEVAGFMFLQTVNRHGALLDHLANVPRLHPERVYAAFAMLAGDLVAFMPERRIAQPFPPYDHDDLERSFRPVLERLRAALSMETDKNAIQIELHERKFGVRVAVIADRALLSEAAFVLAVSAQMPSEALRLRFPSQVKIGPVEKIRDLVNLQLPGVGLHALPVVPRQIPFHAGYNYFELDTGSDLWKQLHASGGLAMHIAGEFPGIELEFWAIRG